MEWHELMHNRSLFAADGTVAGLGIRLEHPATHGAAPVRGISLMGGVGDEFRVVHLSVTYVMP